MPTFKVFHRNPPTFKCNPFAWVDFGKLFVQVATVECDTLDQAFELTNHISSHWGHNKGVQVCAPPGVPLRSTSVGDVIVDAEGRAHMVASAGFVDCEQE